MLSTVAWMILFFHDHLQIFGSQKDEKVITIDQSGSDTLECCDTGKCLYSNLSLALTHLQDNTKIRGTSHISLHHDVEFGNVSSIIIIHCRLQ